MKIVYSISIGYEDSKCELELKWKGHILSLYKHIPTVRVFSLSHEKSM